MNARLDQLGFYIQTFGCQMNENDSQLLCGLLEEAGAHPVDDAADADIVIVNTCCVRETAENRALGYIGSLKHFADDCTTVVVGCMAQKDGVAELLTRSYRHVKIVIGTFAARHLVEYIARSRSTGERIVDCQEHYDGGEARRTLHEPALAATGRKAQVNINYGCNNFCSYCIVPYVRGRERSRAPEEILAEARTLAAHGVKEIQLLGQNVNSYGNDLEQGICFGDLLCKLHEIDGLQRIRYMTSHPRDFSFALIDTILSLPHVCHHFHLPVQSGSDRILKAMNRGYDTEHYRGLIEYIRAHCADAVITTDLIVGFPGENEADFQDTAQLLTDCQFDAAYMFLYSRREGTPAAALPQQVAEDVKKERLQRLMDLQNPISLAANQRLLHRETTLFAEGPSKKDARMWFGRTDGEKIVIFAPPPQIQRGDAVKVIITEAQTWNLFGATCKQGNS